MTLSILLDTDNSFTIAGRGLVVIPPLPPPASLTSSPLRRVVAVEQPDGGRTEIEADFRVEHFVLTGGGGKWATIIVLPGRSRTDVPLGSRITIDADTLAALPLTT
jgi:hypothetical protein